MACGLPADGCRMLDKNSRTKCMTMTLGPSVISCAIDPFDRKAVKLPPDLTRCRLNNHRMFACNFHFFPLVNFHNNFHICSFAANSFDFVTECYQQQQQRANIRTDSRAQSSDFGYFSRAPSVFTLKKSLSMNFQPKSTKTIKRINDVRCLLLFGDD